jgi:hypothetical protein
MTIFWKLTVCSSSPVPRHPRDLIVMHGGGGGGGGGHGGHGGGWGGWGGDGGGGSGGGGNWVVKIAFFLVVAYIVLAGMGVFGH